MGKAADKFLDSGFIPAESCGCPNTGRCQIVTHVVDNIEIKKNAKVTVGLKIHTSPVFAKIKKFSLVVI